MMQYLSQCLFRFRNIGIVFMSSLVLMMLSCLSVAAFADELLVLYPNVRAPFSKVFDDIAMGAKENFEGKSTLKGVSKGDTADKILRKKEPDVVIALGSRSLKSLENVQHQVPVVLGAVSNQQHDFPGISMVPDPKVILDKLLLISPTVGRIHVVKKNNGSSLQLEGAADFLSAESKELIIHETTDLREAASIYAELIDRANEGDAIWILQDGSYVNNAILSLLLDAAWNKNLVVFSSNPLHVKRGALFAVYPDNKKMGGSLGQLANQVLVESVQPGMRPLQDVLLAVNERTGNHLGITLTKEVKENIDLLLPAR